MSDDLGDFFALPPFKAEEALVNLRRQLRELKPLSEKSGADPIRYEIKGLAAIELKLLAGKIEVAAAKKLAQRPDWQKRTLSSSAEVRKFVDDMRRQVSRWEDED